MKVWITYYSIDYESHLEIDKVFDSEEKAKQHIKYKDEMTGDKWGYFDKEIE